MPSPVCFCRGNKEQEAGGGGDNGQAEGQWGEHSASPALGGSQGRTGTSAPRQPNGSRDPSQDPAPCHQSPRLFKKYLKMLWGPGGFFVLFLYPPQEASRFSPTSPLSSGAAAAKTANPSGFAVVSWRLLDAFHPVTTGTKPDTATVPSPPFLTAHFGEMLTWASLSFQHPWSCPTFPPARSLLGLSVPLGVSAGAVPRRGASVNTQGRRGMLGISLPPLISIEWFGTRASSSPQPELPCQQPHTCTKFYHPSPSFPCRLDVLKIFFLWRDKPAQPTA